MVSLVTLGFMMREEIRKLCRRGKKSRTPEKEKRSQEKLLKKGRRGGKGKAGRAADEDEKGTREDIPLGELPEKAKSRTPEKEKK